jgi:type I restriction enzyme S subunit
MTNDGNYQDTFCDWVGEIPKDWNMTRGRFLFNSKKEINRELQCENLLSLTLNGVLNKDYQSSEGLRPENYNTYQIFQKDDLVFKMIDLENIKTSRVGLVHEEGIMSPVYIRHEPIKEKINPKFAYWFYYDLYKKEIYNSIGSGVRSSLSSSDLLEIELPVPPHEEQKLISRYLDKKTSQIDSLVEMIQKKIELLKEQRTSLINHFVTKGLDPNVEMKDSGVEWIGEIPKHWKISKLKFEMEIHNNKRIPLSAEERGQRQGPYPYYGSTSLIDHVDDYLFDGRYILIAEDGANLVMRNLRLSFIVDGKFWVNNHAHILKSKDHSFDEYYCELLEQTDFTTVITGSAQPKLTLEAIKETPLCVPPKHEMDQITGKIQTVLSEYNNLIKLNNKKRELLVEYRQSLISSVVTGKVRVTEDMI